jgi:hypothetical protein
MIPLPLTGGRDPQVGAMEDKHTKIRVKVGASEFEAEGPADIVRDQYKAFLEAAALVGSATLVEPEAAKPATAAPGVQQPPPQPPSLDNGRSIITVDRDSLKRVFAEREAVPSLLALPQGDDRVADALVLLLYGFQELKPQDYPVSGFRLLQAAKLSGIQVSRPDRVLAAQGQHVLTAGFKRGRRYSLNNQGVSRAARLIQGILHGA